MFNCTKASAPKQWRAAWCGSPRIAARSRLYQTFKRPVRPVQGAPEDGPQYQGQQYQGQQPASVQQGLSPQDMLIQQNKELFDTNHDGVLQESEVQAGRELLMKYDLNKDGVLQASELSTIRQAIRAGIFGKTEYDLKIPDMDTKEHLAAFRHVLLGLTLAAILSNMDRVDMSIGIIPISQELGWNKDTAGLVQSAFFQGFMLSQLPSGLLVNSLNARYLLLGGVITWSCATALAPLAVDIAVASGSPALALPALCATRFLVGVGQGCVDASIVDSISRWSPMEERSKSSGLAFNGYNGGMVIGFLLGPWLAVNYGWRALFYAFGVLGGAWALWWAAAVLPLPHPDKSPASYVNMALPLKQPQQQSAPTPARPAGMLGAIRQLPFGLLLSNRAVQGLCICHFIYSWGTFSLGAWLPTYISETIGLSLSSSAFLSILPPVGGIIVGSLATATCDNLVQQGWDLTFVRRMAQVGCFILPAACFAGAVVSTCYCSLGLIMMGQSFHGLAMAGLWSSHAEVSPEYGALLASMTCTCGSIAGAVAVATVGSLYKATGSWSTALVGPMIGLYVLGALVWSQLVVNKPQNFQQGSMQASS